MTSKLDILKALRDREIEPQELPEIAGTWIRYDDPFLQFQSVVESVGGSCVRVPNVQSIHSGLAAQPAFAAAQRIVSFVPTVPGSVDLNEVNDPHELESIDWAIMPGQFGVAENGAIWLTDAGVKHRAIYFIVQHLALVLPSSQIVHNMHEAYQRLAIGGTSLGIFISGPSKTADIEQSLVIGAHGPRSLSVFCVDEA